MRAAALALLVLVLGGAEAPAQATGTIAVQAGVVTEALAITRTKALAFGAVLPGVVATVNPRSSSSAGEFEVSGLRRADFIATFTLPTQLTVGPYSMPIAFGPQAGCQDKDARGSCKYFDPAIPFAGQISNKPAPQNRFFFWIGGTVTPAAAQQPGYYRATIALQVAYTGS